MISTLACARACAAIYDDAAAWDNRWALNDVVAGHKVVDGHDVIALRGSVTALDWMRDAEGWPDWHPKLGFCHRGFLAGMDDVANEVRAATTRPLVITGHSLGGARARILAALLAVNGTPPVQLCVYGSPKPGFANLARIIQKSGMRHDSRRNRNDPVPLVPGILPLWEHSEPWTAFDDAPAPDDLDPLRDHHIQHYVAGEVKLAAVPSLALTT